MVLQNVHRIAADIKKKSYLIEEPRVTSNDDIAFIVSVTDNGKAIDTAAVATAVLASTRPDRQTVITAGTKLADGTIKFELGHTETQIAGQVKAVAQLYDAEGDRISSLSWSYIVDRDPTGEGYIPTEKDKTFIEVVLVDGPTIIQEAKDVTLAAQQSVVNSDAATGRAITAATDAEAIVGEFAAFKQSDAKAKEFPSVDARFEELEKDGYFPVKNEIVNGAFNDGVSAGLRKLEPARGTIISLDTSEFISSPQSVKWVQNNNNLYYIWDVPGKANDKLYFSSYVKKTAGVSLLLGTFTYGATANLIALTSFGDEAVPWHRYSVIANAGTAGLSFTIGNGTGATGEVHLDNVLSINLTTVFGAGNEPTVEQMDSLLAQYPNSWFDGTVNLAENKKLLPFLLNQIRKKASKQQEAWITPTLLNGWTAFDAARTVMFRKDEMGRVQFKGSVKGESASSIILVLPEAYRPKATMHFIANANNTTFSTLYISAGNVYFGQGNLSHTSLDGISYFVD